MASLLWILRFWVRLTDLTKDQVVNFPVLPATPHLQPTRTEPNRGNPRSGADKCKVSAAKVNGQRIFETTKVKHVSFKCCEYDREFYTFWHVVKWSVGVLGIRDSCVSAAKPEYLMKCSFFKAFSQQGNVYSFRPQILWYIYLYFQDISKKIFSENSTRYQRCSELWCNIHDIYNINKGTFHMAYRVFFALA